MSSEQAELRDLPDQQDEKPKINICSPKIIVLTILSTYFISQNIYNYYMYPPPAPKQPLPEIDQWQNFVQMWDRFQGYVIVSVVGFIIFWFLRKSNDKYDEQQFQKIQRQQREAEQRQRKLQAEREQKIIRKLEEEERLAEERQMHAAQSNKQTKDSAVLAQKKVE